MFRIVPTRRVAVPDRARRPPRDCRTGGVRARGDRRGARVLRAGHGPGREPVVKDRAVGRAVAGVPPSQRVVQVTWVGVSTSPSDSWAALDRQVRAATGSVRVSSPTAVLIYRDTRFGKEIVRLGAVDGLDKVVELSSGRLAEQVRPGALRRRCDRGSEHRDAGPDRDRARLAAGRRSSVVLPQRRAERSPAARRGGRSHVAPPEARRLPTDLRLGRAAAARGRPSLGRRRLPDEDRASEYSASGRLAELCAERADGRSGRRGHEGADCGPPAAARRRAGGRAPARVRAARGDAAAIRRPGRRAQAGVLRSNRFAEGSPRSPRRSSSCSPQPSSAGCSAPA